MNERHRQKRLTALRYVLALPRSVWYNLRLLPLRQAVRLPLLVSHRTRVENLGGKVVLDTPALKTGLVEIGFTTCQCSDFRYDRTRLNIRGQVIVKGKCTFGAGSSVEVGENGILTLGDRFHLGPKSLLICHKEINFGYHSRVSWCSTIMDTDQHRLVDSQGECRNADRPVTVGDNVWIGCHAIIPKGVTLASDTTVGAGAVLRGHYDEEMTVLAGNPAVVVRRGVKRETAAAVNNL